MRLFAAKPEGTRRPLPEKVPAVRTKPLMAWDNELGRDKASAVSPLTGHAFARVAVYPAGAGFLAKRAPIAGPESTGVRFEPEEPVGDFNEEEEGFLAEPGRAGEEAETFVEPAAADKAPPPVPKTIIRGPQELWNFNGETPASYSVSSVLRTNRTGGTFNWTVSPHLTLSSAADATPTVTTASPSIVRRDARIRVSHTDTSGVRSAASYRLTILAPESLTHLRNVDNADATYAYETEIHYSIHDQFGTILPRNVPINEQWSGGVVADSAGMDWRRGAEGGATVNPADWHDRVQGESAGHIPAPVAPAHADAAVAVYHWPGDWRVGSLTIGSGRRVRSVTWQKNRGFARHT